MKKKPIKETLMTIKKVKSTEHWFICTGSLLGKRVCGYGTTMGNAIDDACRDYQLIIKL